MRKYLRAIARAKMKKEGVKKINKRSYTIQGGIIKKIPSYFAEHWREYLSK